MNRDSLKQLIRKEIKKITPKNWEKITLISKGLIMIIKLKIPINRMTKSWKEFIERENLRR